MEDGSKGSAAKSRRARAARAAAARGAMAAGSRAAARAADSTKGFAKGPDAGLAGEEAPAPERRAGSASTASARRARRKRIAQRAAAEAARAALPIGSHTGERAETVEADDRRGQGAERAAVRRMASTGAAQSARGAKTAGRLAAARLSGAVRGGVAGFRAGASGPAGEACGARRRERTPSNGRPSPFRGSPRARGKARAARAGAVDAARSARSAAAGLASGIGAALPTPSSPARAAAAALPVPKKAAAWAASALLMPLLLVLAVAALPAMGAVAVGALTTVLGGSQQSSGAVAGLPAWFTADMVEAAIECQEKYGHPASATIAQAIWESGAGDEPSQLAARDNNLFGMKWYEGYAGSDGVAGPVAYPTQEETDGVLHWVDDLFIKFTGKPECIRFRSEVFLQAAHYRDNAFIKEAIAARDPEKFIAGLKDAGWATDSSYVDHLTAMLDSYSLRRFDTMTVESWRASQAGGGGQQYDAANDRQKRVADASRTTDYGWPQGWCQAWVSSAYGAAGESDDSMCCAHACGDAWIVSNRSDNIPVGATVYVSRSHKSATEGSRCGCGRDFGHVGIYIGDGMVSSRKSGTGPYIESLESFMANGGLGGWMGWGWNGGVALN